MKAKLKIETKSEVYYYENGVKINGAPSGVSGDLSGVRGDLSGVRGDLTGVRGNLTRAYGDLTGVSGNLTGVYGDLSGVSGNLDECEISDEDRKKGIRIEDLIEKDKA